MQGVISSVAQITEFEVSDICSRNGRLMAEAKNECRTPKKDEIEISKEAQEITKLDHLRYLLWIDPTRANAFYHKKLFWSKALQKKHCLHFFSITEMVLFTITVRQQKLPL